MEAWEREVLDTTFRLEGGKVDNPADPGGPTHMGVTLPTLTDYLGRPATKADLWALTREQAEDLYLTLFIRRPRFHEIIYPKVRALVIDCGVLHHPVTAARFLQRACRVKDDGKVGTITLFSAARRDPTALYCDILAERAEFFGRLISKDLTDRDRDGIPDNTEFAAGWMTRGLATWLRRAV